MFMYHKIMMETYTVKELAALIKLSPATVRRWIALGMISAEKIGGNKAGYRIPEREIVRLTKI